MLSLEEFSGKRKTAYQSTALPFGSMHFLEEEVKVMRVKLQVMVLKVTIIPVRVTAMKVKLQVMAAKVMTILAEMILLVEMK